MLYIARDDMFYHINLRLIGSYIILKHFEAFAVFTVFRLF
jgi:hypothetical protein